MATSDVWGGTAGDVVLASNCNRRTTETSASSFMRFAARNAATVASAAPASAHVGVASSARVLYPPSVESPSDEHVGAVRSEQLEVAHSQSTRSCGGEGGGGEGGGGMGSSCVDWQSTDAPSADAVGTRAEESGAVQGAVPGAAHAAMDVHVGTVAQAATETEGGGHGCVSARGARVRGGNG